MHFRIRGDRDIKIAYLFQQRHQIGGVHIRFTAARRQVAAQGDDMADTVVPVILSDSAQLIAAGIDTGQVRRCFQTGSLFNAFDDAVGAIALARVRAIGYRNKLRFQTAQAIDGFHRVCSISLVRGGKNSKDTLIWPDFRRSDSGLPLIGVKKLIPYLINRM